MSSVHIRARFDGRAFVPEEPVDLPPGAVFEGWVTSPKEGRIGRRAGSAKAKGTLFVTADDFDAPMEEFAEYE